MSQMGQKAKYSLRADVFRFAPDSGLKSDIAGGPFRARKRLMHRSKTVVFSSCHKVRPYQLKEAAIGNADLCSYSRQKMRMVAARYPRFSSRLSLDTSENEHSDLQSIDQLPPLRYP